MLVLCSQAFPTRLRRPRFVPYEKIAHVEVERVGWKSVLSIELTSGKTITVSLMGDPRLANPQECVERIREAKNAATSAAGG